MQIRSDILARNTLLNFVGQVLPLLVGLVALPLIIQGLGKDRFGILSLAWVILGYFSVFDIGLGRATTKYVAEAIGKGDEEQIHRLVWTSVTVQGILGVIGSVVFVVITPLIVERILNIPPDLIGEAKSTFYLLALSVSLILISSSFSGVLEASQRFDLVNVVRVPSSLFSFLIPLLGLTLGYQLPGIVLLIVISRLLSLVALMILAFRVFPALRKYSSHLPLFIRLFKFGGWISVSSIAGPILIYLDRFLIGAFLSMAMVTYYTAPFEVITRLWIIPGSLVMTLFPAFSTLGGLGRHDQTQAVLLRSTKYLLILITPIIFLVISFAQPILELWLGADFGQNSSLVLQILAVGALVGVLAPVPGAILHGYGRPDIIAKLYLAYIPLNFILVIFFIKIWGLPGAALSFTVRTLLDSVLLFSIALRITHQSAHSFLKEILATLGAVLLAGVLFSVTLWTIDSLSVRSAVVAGIIALFIYVVWTRIFSEEDRSKLESLIKGKGWQSIKQN